MESGEEVSRRNRCTPGILSYQSSCAWRAGFHAPSAACAGALAGTPATVAPTTPAPTPKRARKDLLASRDSDPIALMWTSSTFGSFIPSSGNSIDPFPANSGFQAGNGPVASLREAAAHAVQNRLESAYTVLSRHTSEKYFRRSAT